MSESSLPLSPEAQEELTLELCHALEVKGIIPSHTKLSVDRWVNQVGIPQMVVSVMNYFAGRTHEAVVQQLAVPANRWAHLRAALGWKGWKTRSIPIIVQQTYVCPHVPKSDNQAHAQWVHDAAEGAIDPTAPIEKEEQE